MKRILSLVIVLSFLFSGMVFAWQDNYDYTMRLDFYTYTSDNTTGAYKVTYVPKTTLIPGVMHIIGYSIMPISANSENVVALHDAESTDVYVDESLIDETECVANSFDGKWFPYPKAIKTQLCIRQGSQTRVMVYYSNI